MKKRLRTYTAILVVLAVVASLLPGSVMAVALTAGSSGKTVTLPVVAEGEEAPASYEFSVFSLTPNEEGATYAYIGAGSILIEKEIVIYQPESTTPVPEAPAANGILQLLDASGAVVASSAAMNEYDHRDDYYYVSYEEILDTGAISSGTYGLQLAAGNEIYPCSGSVLVIGTDRLLITQASVQGMYAGVAAFEVQLKIYGFETEDDLDKLSFKLLDQTDTEIATSTGAFRDVSTSYSDGGWNVYAQMEVASGQSVAENLSYGLQIGYSGSKDLVDGVGAATMSPYVPSLGIVDFAVTNAQTAEVSITLENWEHAQSYRVVVSEQDGDGTVYGEITVTGEALSAADGMVTLALTMGGVTMPMTGYGEQLYLCVYEGEQEYSRVSDYVQNPYANLNQGQTHFYPYSIKALIARPFDGYMVKKKHPTFVSKIECFYGKG